MNDTYVDLPVHLSRDSVEADAEYALQCCCLLRSLALPIAHAWSALYHLCHLLHTISFRFASAGRSASALYTSTYSQGESNSYGPSPFGTVYRRARTLFRRSTVLSSSICTPDWFVPHTMTVLRNVQIPAGALQAPSVLAPGRTSTPGCGLAGSPCPSLVLGDINAESSSAA